MTFFWLFLAFIISQRLIELLIAKRNEKILMLQGAEEFDKNGYKIIVLMHISFFVSLIIEKILIGHRLNGNWIVLISLFSFAQILRYWAIISLGVFWNTKIIVLPGSKLIKSGPYKYIHHPNYFAVITEIAVIPLIFTCYFTAIVFSVLNLILLNRRIKIEEQALQSIFNPADN